MKLKIVIVDFELSPHAKKRLLRIGVPLAILLGGATVAYAGGNWALPNQWSMPGSPGYAGPNLKAADLDSNFAALADAGSALDQRVTTLEGANAATLMQYSPNAIFCGVTPIAYDGNLKAAVPGAANGYAAAKTLCEGVAGCGPAAHMCTSEELVRTLALGKPFPGSAPLPWYSSGQSGSTLNGANVLDDCDGWTNNAPTTPPRAGLLTNPYGPGYNACPIKAPVMCCL